MTEIQIKEYTDYIRPRLNRASNILNNITPDEDNSFLYTQLLNIAEDIKSAVSLMKVTEKKGIREAKRRARGR